MRGMCMLRPSIFIIYDSISLISSLTYTLVLLVWLWEMQHLLSLVFGITNIPGDKSFCWDSWKRSLRLLNSTIKKVVSPRINPKWTKRWRRVDTEWSSRIYPQLVCQLWEPEQVFCALACLCRLETKQAWTNVKGGRLDIHLTHSKFQYTNLERVGVPLGNFDIFSSLSPHWGLDYAGYIFLLLFSLGCPWVPKKDSLHFPPSSKIK